VKRVLGKMRAILTGYSLGSYLLRDL
jgi:hypothetical protein